MSTSPVITLSIEIELGWGRHFIDTGDSKKLEVFSSGRAVETSVLKSLLEVCDRHDITITFDIVGHLLLDDCDGFHKGPYRKGWFSSDPGTNTRTDPLFYAPDLIDLITNADQNHEIATHTFSHVLFDDVDDAVANHEFGLVDEVHNRSELESPSSIVSPQHTQVPFQILRDNGIDAIRLPSHEVRQERWPVQSLNVLSRSHVVRDFEMEDEIVKTYCTPWPSLTSPTLPTGQRPVSPPLSWIPLGVRKSLHKAKIRGAVDETIREDSHLHLWTHLFNMANPQQWSVIQEVLPMLGENNRIKIRPMRDLASEV